VEEDYAKTYSQCGRPRDGGGGVRQKWTFVDREEGGGPKSQKCVDVING
jgi:hypothetical protein